MASADFSSILNSLDRLSASEQAQLSAILAAKISAQPVGIRSKGNTSGPGIGMSDSDWDELAADPQLAVELATIDQEFSATLLDGLEGNS